MKRILPLILSGAAFILAFLPAVKAQEINVGPNGITVYRHHRYSQEEGERWERERERQRRDNWERQRERQRELWRERFYERNGYYPD
jgi:hypothetical protein